MKRIELIQQIANEIEEFINRPLGVDVFGEEETHDMTLYYIKRRIKDMNKIFIMTDEEWDKKWKESIKEFHENIEIEMRSGVL